MIGVKYYNDKSRIFYIQTNNSLECFLAKYNRQIKIKAGYLWSCGISSSCIAMSAFGYDLPKCAEGILFDVLNSESFYHLYTPLKKQGINIAASIGNLFSEAYPIAVKEAFGATASIGEKVIWTDLIHMLKNDYPFQFAFKEPSHYNAAVAYDEKNNIIKRVDPWPGNTMNKQGGWHEDLTEEMFNENVIDKVVIYGC